MLSDPILTVECSDCEDVQHIDVRSLDNLLVYQVALMPGRFASHVGKVPVVTMHVAGSRYIGEPNSSSDAIIDHHHSTLMIPVELLRGMLSSIEETLVEAEEDDVSDQVFEFFLV